MLRRLRLVRYKGFEDFTLNLKGSTVLVGPNNAGKTTIINALLLCAHLIRHAGLRKPDIAIRDESRHRDGVGYSLTFPQQYIRENVRHEFRELGARIELLFQNGAALYAIWPVEEAAFFYLEHAEGLQPRTIRMVKEYFHTLGVVPTLAPVEHREYVLSESHVRENLATRLVSRHFRNQLHWQQQRDPEAYANLLRYIVDRTPEIDYLQLLATWVDGQQELDLFYCEAATHTEKEIYWAGDGLQIWLQILFHLWRQEVPTLVLDEPDVFLHPDLQRRLVNVLEDIDSQIILATHAPEILSEASRDAVVIVDRMRRNSRRVADDRALSKLNDMLGSAFNLRLAKALRSRVVLFVEGDDMRILRNLAKTLGARRFYTEQGLTVVPMEGYSNRAASSSFGLLNTTFLGGAVDVIVVLDRDYRSDQTAHDHIAEIQSAGVRAHIWKRKELESYLLAPTAIARISGLPTEIIEPYMLEAMESLRSAVLARYLSERSKEERPSGRSDVTINQHYIEEFDLKWPDYNWRLTIVPPKDLLALVNQKIQTTGGRSVSMRNLSSRISRDEIPPEMSELIGDIEALLHAQGGTKDPRLL